jgi:hypothetical protein
VRRGDDHAYAEPAERRHLGSISTIGSNTDGDGIEPTRRYPRQLYVPFTASGGRVSMEGAAAVLGSLVVGIPIGLALAL